MKTEDLRHLADGIRARRPDLRPVTLSKSAARRYSLHALYAPNQTDRHGDRVTEDQLWDAVASYVEKSAADRTIYLEHSPKPAGRWVHCFICPADMTTDLTIPGQTPRQVTLPKGTALLGVRWNEETWPMVEAGQLRGLSLGGKARRKRKQRENRK